MIPIKWELIYDFCFILPTRYASHPMRAKSTNMDLHAQRTDIYRSHISSKKKKQ